MKLPPPNEMTGHLLDNPHHDPSRAGALARRGLCSHHAEHRDPRPFGQGGS
jgi:hypothetical protein